MRAALGFLVLAAAALPALAAPGKDAPPNVVLILADDLGWTGLGCYGSDLHETPHLDRLAAEGVRFTEACAASPVCTPTRASIQTGLHPARLHMTVWREAAKVRGDKRPLLEPVCEEDLAHKYVTLGELLKGGGYLTAHVGKWHLGSAMYFPESQGYDISVGGNIWGAPDSFWHPFRGAERFQREGFRYVPGMDFTKEGDYLTDKLTDVAVHVIDFAGAKPFFLNLCYYAVHTPIEAKEKDREYFAKKIGPQSRHRNATYAAMHRSLDENVGRILAKLEERGLAGNTIVIFLSDNGGFEGRFDGETVTNNLPLRSGKGSLYEGGVRIPLVVRWPGVAVAGSVCRTPVVTTDLFPTIAEMTGLAEAAGKTGYKLDGVSFAPLLAKPDARLAREDLHFHYPHYYSNTGPVSAIRSGSWKLLHYYEDRHVELYDLASDPAEKQDVSKQKPDLAKELSAKLASWLNRTKAQFPAANPAAAKAAEKQ